MRDNLLVCEATMIVILHNIRSLYNVGSIFRIADAVGVEKIYLAGITPKPVDRFGNPRPQLTKVALGAEKSVSWEQVFQVNALLRKLKREGYEIFAIEQGESSTPYYKLRTSSRKKKIALILGNEVKGLPKSVLDHAREILEIPMSGSKESLNVAVAFGIVVFHMKWVDCKAS